MSKRQIEILRDEIKAQRDGLRFGDPLPGPVVAWMERLIEIVDSHDKVLDAIREVTKSRAEKLR